MNTIICFSFVVVFGLSLFSVRYECYSFWGFYVLQFMYVYEYEYEYEFVCVCVRVCVFLLHLHAFTK